MSCAANARDKGQAAMDQTFLMTNIVPQHPQLNRNVWSSLESWCRHLTKRHEEVLVITGSLYLPKKITTLEATDATDVKDRNQTSINSSKVNNKSSSSGSGVLSERHEVHYQVLPSFANDPKPRIAVPTHLYKIILCHSPSRPFEQPMLLGSFVMPNDVVDPATPLTRFATPLADIEYDSGFRFFPKLRDQIAAMPQLISHSSSGSDADSVLLLTDSATSKSGKQSRADAKSQFESKFLSDQSEPAAVSPASRLYHIQPLCSVEACRLTSYAERKAKRDAS